MSHAHANATHPLRVGLIVDSETVSAYVADWVHWVKSQDAIVISHLIIQDLPARPGGRIARIFSTIERQGFKAYLEGFTFSIITRLEALRLKRTEKFRDHFDREDICGLVPKRVRIAPIVSPSGHVYRYRKVDVEIVKALNLDVMIRCGSGILRGDMLQAARLGILSFHHADNRVNRGVPAGFWEVYHRHDATGFTLQRLTEELDGGDVLMRGQFATRPYYLLNQAALYKKSNFYMKKLLADIATMGTLPPTERNVPYYNPLYRRPDLGAQVRYVLYLAWAYAVSLFQRLVLRRTGRWGVAFVASGWRNLVMWRAQRIPNPPNGFLADPFLITHENKTYCFVEEYDDHQEKGRIAAYALSTTRSDRLGDALIEPFHLSFPYVFAYQGRYYMCPETRQNNDIRLYECIEFPLRWQLKKVIFSNVSAVDTMLFEYDGRWWLFTNIDPADADDRCAELFIYYADNPLADVWTPHPQNPVMIDATKARNGGILYDQGKIYRVSQQQGFDSYGKSAWINEIITLTTEAYEEAPRAKVEPNFFKRLSGCHHMHSDGKFTAFDYVIHAMTP